jgi:glycerol-1-phosphate dehydrogenase [NAD(P)+]
MLTPDDLSASRADAAAAPSRNSNSEPTARLLRTSHIEVSSPTMDEGASGREFAGWVRDAGYGRMFVVASRHGRDLADALEGVIGRVQPPPRAGRAWVEVLCREVAHAGTEAVVAIGGGRCLDVAKLAADRCGVPLIAVPTQLSHDGICSPVSVVPNDNGTSDSIPSTAPAAAFFSIATLARSPLRSLRAGIGDLLSNPFALRDWELAAVTGMDTLDEGAWHLSMESMTMIEPSLERLDDDGLRRSSFLGLLSHALANSGVAMMLAGSSRPASGAEHKISHAIDHGYGGRALHGEQVAFGCIISAALHGLAVTPLVQVLARLELPHKPEHLGLSHDELAWAIVQAPAMRPGRYTVLEKAQLDEASARDLIEGIWGS